MTMPAYVLVRQGTIFDKYCDLLVIPTSDKGNVEPEIEQELPKFGIPLPTYLPSLPLGSVTLTEFTHTQFRKVAYAVTAQESGKARDIARRIGLIGSQLGIEVARESQARAAEPLPQSASLTALARYAWRTLLPRPIKVAVPLFTAGELKPQAVARALIDGFRLMAPETALLVISTREKAHYEALTQILPHPTGPVKRHPTPVSVGSGTDQPVRKPKATGEQPLKTPLPTPDAGPAMQGTTTLARVGKDPPPPVQSGGQRTRIFISYSHQDTKWLRRLQKHLHPLDNGGALVWDDTRLRPGEPWREEIRQALAETKVAIMLISADFLASEFIVTEELPALLHAAKNDGATILPVVVSPCRLEQIEKLLVFQAVNIPQKPLLKLRRGDQEEVFVKVARAVEEALKR